MVTCIDFKGSIPKWIVKKASVKGPYMWVKSFRKGLEGFTKRKKQGLVD